MMPETRTIPGMGGREREHGEIIYAVSPAHPEAERYPWLDEDELAALAADIAANGQRHKIKRLWDGRIVDGRNRELACLVARVPPDYETVELDESEVPALVRSENAFRRHLSAAFRRELIADALRENPEKANRMIATETGVSDKTVASVREELVATAEIPQLDETKGKDGKKRPANKAARTRKAKPVVPSEPAAVVPPEPPPHPFAELMSLVSSCSRAITVAVRCNDPLSVRLRECLSECGLLDHVPEKVLDSGEVKPARIDFLPLRGVHRVLDIAADPTVPLKRVQHEYMVASGGVLPPATLRRRNQRKGKRG